MHKEPPVTTVPNADREQGDTAAEDLSPFALIWSVAKELVLVLVPALVLALLVNRLVVTFVSQLVVMLVIRLVSREVCKSWSSNSSWVV